MLSGPIWTLLAAVGVPSATVGFCFWLLQRKINKHDAKEALERKVRQEEVDRRNEASEKLLLYLIHSTHASLELCKATAEAVKNIPDTNCNGDMDAALRRASEVQREMNDLVNRELAHQMFGAA